MAQYAVIDIETTGLNRYKDSINYIGVGVAYSTKSNKLDEVHVLNMFEGRDLPKFKALLKRLKEEKTRLVWQNGKFDTLFILEKYKKLLPIHEDVMLLGTAYSMAETHALDDMVERYLGEPSWDIPLKEKIKPNNPIVEKYLVKDLEYPWRLLKYFKKRFNEQQSKIYKSLLKPAYLMYRDVEISGIYIDQEGLQKVRKVYKKKEKEALDILLLEHDINWNSSAQVADVLFKKEKLPVQKVSEKTGKPSADAKVLRKLAYKGFKLPQLIMDYKTVNTANKMFLNRWGDYIAADGRIHPDFNLTNVVTGRTSCKNPNLQQVPRNKDLRTLYTAPPGRVLIEADYSQIELRIAAEYAQEPTMLRIYREGGDIHTETAASVSGISPKDVTKELRNKAKAVNFGFLYGMSARGFISYAFDNYGVIFTLEEAKRYRELFFLKYSRLEAWHRDMGVLCELDGGVYNRFGRFRTLPDIYSSSNYERSSAIRKAINSPVQGTASDLLILAATEVNKKLKEKYGAFVVGTVHDSILIESPEEGVEDVAEDIKRIMAHPEALDLFGVEFEVSIEADVGIGPWGSK